MFLYARGIVTAKNLPHLTIDKNSLLMRFFQINYACHYSFDFSNCNAELSWTSKVNSWNNILSYIRGKVSLSIALIYLLTLKKLKGHKFNVRCFKKLSSYLWDRAKQKIWPCVGCRNDWRCHLLRILSKPVSMKYFYFYHCPPHFKAKTLIQIMFYKCTISYQ